MNPKCFLDKSKTLLGNTILFSKEKTSNILLDFGDELIEIVSTSMDIGNEACIIHVPISMYQAVSKIKERFEALK
jgi:hypothetical protein